jgi:hypothetical protein
MRKEVKHMDNAPRRSTLFGGAVLGTVVAGVLAVSAVAGQGSTATTAPQGGTQAVPVQQQEPDAAPRQDERPDGRDCPEEGRGEQQDGSAAPSADTEV